MNLISLINGAEREAISRAVYHAINVLMKTVTPVILTERRDYCGERAFLRKYITPSLMDLSSFREFSPAKIFILSL